MVARVSLLEKKNLVHMVHNVKKKQPGHQEEMIQLENRPGKEDFAISVRALQLQLILVLLRKIAVIQ